MTSKIKIIYLIILLFLGISIIHSIYAEEIVTTVKILNDSESSLTDPMNLSATPYNSSRQDLFGIKLDSLEYTTVDDLTLGDRIEFKLEDFDFKDKIYRVEDHNIVIASVKVSDALIYVYSDPKDFVLIKGQNKEIDINDDGLYDIKARYDGLDSETKMGRFSFMRATNPNYKIYGNTFCHKDDPNSEFYCYEVINKETGEYRDISQSLALDSKSRNEQNMTQEEELDKQVSKYLENSSNTGLIKSPEDNGNKGLLSIINFKVIIFIIFIIVAIVVFIKMKNKFNNGGTEINFDDE